MASRVMKIVLAPRAAFGRTRPLMIGGYGALGLLLVGVLWFAIAQPVQVLPLMGQAPAFTLTDEHGAWLGVEELGGRVLLVSFGYARCGAACEPVHRRLGEVRGALAEAGLAGDGVVILTISVDPADTPDVLRAYAAELGAGDDTWRLLTGAPQEVKEIVGRGFSVYYGARQPGEAGPPIELDQRVVLVDGTGEIRAAYTPDRFEPWRVLRDVELVRREASSTGWRRPIYDMAHLFVCYPE
ncbi:MAG: hypothetical protein RLZZ387_5148 [Chloroflexota bacterium]